VAAALALGPEPRLEGTQTLTGAVVRTVLPTGLDVRDGIVAGRVVRLLTGLRDGVDVTVDVVPNERRARIEHFATGIAFEDGDIVARSPRGTEFRLGLGERALVTFEAATAKPLTVDEAVRLLDGAARVPPVLYAGPYAPAVERSLTVLRLLTHEPTGGLVASPRRPQVQLGLQVEAMHLFRACGWVEEAELASEWVVRTLGEVDFPVPPAWSIDGQAESDEQEWLVWAAPALADHEELWPVLRGAAAWLADHWPEAPDATATLAARRALDRIGRQAQARNPLDLDAVAWRMQAKKIEVPGADAPGADAPGADAPGADAPAAEAPSAVAEPDPETEPRPSIVDLARHERWEEAHEAMEQVLAEPVENGARPHLDLAAAAIALAKGPR